MEEGSRRWRSVQTGEGAGGDEGAEQRSVAWRTEHQSPFGQRTSISDRGNQTRDAVGQANPEVAGASVATVGSPACGDSHSAHDCRPREQAQCRLAQRTADSLRFAVLGPGGCDRSRWADPCGTHSQRRRRLGGRTAGTLRAESPKVAGGWLATVSSPACGDSHSTDDCRPREQGQCGLAGRRADAFGRAKPKVTKGWPGALGPCACRSRDSAPQFRRHVQRRYPLPRRAAEARTTSGAEAPRIWRWSTVRLTLRLRSLRVHSGPAAQARSALRMTIADRPEALGGG